MPFTQMSVGKDRKKLDSILRIESSAGTSKQKAAADKLASVEAADIVLDTSCLQFKQKTELSADGSDTSESGDSEEEEEEIDKLRLGGEDFQLGPLTNNEGRAQLEERKKRSTLEYLYG